MFFLYWNKALIYFTILLFFLGLFSQFSQAISMSGCSSASKLPSLNCNEISASSGSFSGTQWFKVKANKLGDLDITLEKPSSVKSQLYVFESCSDSSGDYICKNSSNGTSRQYCNISDAKGYYYIGVYRSSGSGNFQVDAELDCYDCVPCYRNYCSGNDVWCEDSCGVESKVKEHCGSIGCSNGKCNSQPSCTNECSQGQARCNGSYSQVCGNYDSDSCLEWNSGTYCQYGCSNTSCNSPPLSVSIISSADSIDEGYFGSVQWQTTGSVKETGIQVAYKSDKSDASRNVLPLNSSGIYTTILKPKDYSLPFMYVRVFAVSNSGETKYSDWKTITLSAMCNASSCGNTIPFQVEELNVFEIGWNVLKFVTIGGCMDNGFFSFSCTLDLVTIIPIGEAAKVIDAGAKIEKLSKSSKILKEAGTLEKIANAFRKVRLTVNGVKYSIEGRRLARAAELGIMEVDFAKGEIRTGFKSLSKEFLEKGETVIVDLKKSGATNQILEDVLAKGGNLQKTIRATDSVKGTAWLEEGDNLKGWVHIFRGHVKPGDFKKAGIAEEEVQDYIIKTVKEPSKGILPSRGSKNWWCFFKFSKTVSTGSPFVKVIIDNKGYIRNAYPTGSFTCS